MYRAKLTTLLLQRRWFSSDRQLVVNTVLIHLHIAFVLNVSPSWREGKKV